MSTPSYNWLLNEARRDILKADFDKIRDAYTQREGYNPYQQSSGTEALRAAIKKQDWSEAGLLCTELLKQDFLQIGIHQMIAQLFKRVGESERGEWHQSFANGLLNAIVRSGDGRSFERAYRIVHIREELDALRLLDFIPMRRRKVSHQGRHYEVFSVVNADGKDQGQIYFDVEIMQGFHDPDDEDLE